MVRSALTMAARLASTALSASGIRTDIHPLRLLLWPGYRPFDARHKGLAKALEPGQRHGH
jgi:hypothetical protein